MGGKKKKPLRKPVRTAFYIRCILIHLKQINKIRINKIDFFFFFFLRGKIENLINPTCLYCTFFIFKSAFYLIQAWAFQDCTIKRDAHLLCLPNL